MMDSHNARQRLLTIVPQLNHWQVFIALKFIEIYTTIFVLDETFTLFEDNHFNQVGLGFEGFECIP